EHGIRPRRHGPPANAPGRVAVPPRLRSMPLRPPDLQARVLPEHGLQRPRRHDPPANTPGRHAGTGQDGGQRGQLPATERPGSVTRRPAKLLTSARPAAAHGTTNTLSQIRPDPASYGLTLRLRSGRAGRSSPGR